MTKLIVYGTHLCVPNGDSLIYQYPSGDVDVCRWPMSSDEERWRLASALYDAIEMGDLPDSTASVTLPDGTESEIESTLASGEAYFKQLELNARSW